MTCWGTGSNWRTRGAAALAHGRWMKGYRRETAETTPTTTWIVASMTKVTGSASTARTTGVLISITAIAGKTQKILRCCLTSNGAHKWTSMACPGIQNSTAKEWRLRPC